MRGEKYLRKLVSRQTAQEVYKELEPYFLPDQSDLKPISVETSTPTQEYILSLIRDEYGEEAVKQYETIYNKHFNSDHLYNSLSAQVDIDTRKKLDSIQALVDLRVHLCEAKGTYEVGKNEELIEAVRQEIENELLEGYKDTAAQEAYLEFLNHDKALKGGESELPEFDEILGEKNRKEAEEEKEEMIKRFKAMSETDQMEYVVRGAPIMCMMGSHSRHLDMYRSHGVYINRKAVAFEGDCIVDENIPYFGHCNSPSCTLTETISLKLGPVVNAAGVALEEVDERVFEGIKCVPWFVGKWKNTHFTTLLARDEPPQNFRGRYNPYYGALTTASYLVCKHGGLVYPLTSGQIDEAYYHAAFQQYPFHDFGSKEFYKWCRENDICPTIAGDQEHIEWHQNKINEALADLAQAKENYGDQKEMSKEDYLYNPQ